MRKIDWEKVHDTLINNSISFRIKDLQSLDGLLPKDMIDKLEDMEIIKYDHDAPIINDTDFLDYDEFFEVVNIIFK